MARRSDHSSEELKSLAINKACDLITAKGEAGFQARLIAEEMGYTVGTLYYLFGSMNQLRYHIRGRILDQHFNIIKAEISKKKDKLNYHITRYIQFAFENPHYSSFLYAYRAGPREKIPDWYLEKYDQHFKLFITTFQAQIKDEKTALKASKTIWAYIHGVCMLTLYEKLPMMSEKNAESMVKHLVSTYLSGLQN